MIDSPAGVLGLVAGALLLVAGRRLFWLFVGLVGFFAGLRFAPVFLSGQPEWMQWLVAALFGLAGMFLAVVLQRLAVAVAGFLVGGFFAADLFGVDFAQPGLAEVLVFVAGGVVAAMLSLWLFEGALILLSSLVGASLIVDGFDLASGTRSLALIGLTVLGIAIQAGITSRTRRRNPDRARPPVHFLLLMMMLLLGSIPAAAQDRQPSGGEIRILHSSTSRFVGTVQRAFPFEPFSGPPPVPLSIDIRLVVLVHVNRWLDTPNVILDDGMLALFLDDPRRWFGHLPAAWSGKTFAPAGKTWLFTLTSTASPRGGSYQLEVSPYKGAKRPS